MIAPRCCVRFARSVCPRAKIYYYRRLAFLSNKLLHAVPHCAGLNPKAFRAGASRTAGARELRHVLDGGLLRLFASLDAELQARIARQIGTTAQQLLRSLDAFRLSI